MKDHHLQRLDGAVDTLGLALLFIATWQKRPYTRAYIVNGDVDILNIPRTQIRIYAPNPTASIMSILYSQPSNICWEIVARFSHLKPGEEL